MQKQEENIALRTHQTLFAAPHAPGTVSPAATQGYLSGIPVVLMATRATLLIVAVGHHGVPLTFFLTVRFGCFYVFVHGCQ